MHGQKNIKLGLLCVFVSIQPDDDHLGSKHVAVNSRNKILSTASALLIKNLIFFEEQNACKLYIKIHFLRLFPLGRLPHSSCLGKYSVYIVRLCDIHTCIMLLLLLLLLLLLTAIELSLGGSIPYTITSKNKCT